MIEWDVFDDFGDEVASLFVAAVDEVGDGGAWGEDDADGGVEFIFEHGEDAWLHGSGGGDDVGWAVALDAGDLGAACFDGVDEFVEAGGRFGEFGVLFVGESCAF